MTRIGHKWKDLIREFWSKSDAKILTMLHIIKLLADYFAKIDKIASEIGIYKAFSRGTASAFTQRLPPNLFLPYMIKILV